MATATISEARLRANSENAKKSTGPRTEEGKARSRRNAVKHGLSGAGVALAEEDEKALKERLAKWKTELWPDGLAEEALVASAALASVRLERCRVSESARLARRRRHAVDDWENRRRDEVERLGLALLAGGETRARFELERTSAGCEWLIGRWRGVAAELKRKRRLDAGQARCILLLAGVRPEDPIHDRKAIAWLDAIERVGEAGDGGRRLRLRIAGELYRLRDEAGDRATLHDEADREGVADEALVDTSHEGVLHRRYEAASESALHRSLSHLERLRSGIKDGKASPVAPPVTKREFDGEGWVEVPVARPRRYEVDDRPYIELEPGQIALGVATIEKSAERRRLKQEAKAQRRAERHAERAAAPVEPRREREPETKPAPPIVPRPDLRRRVGRGPSPALRASALGLVLAILSLGAAGAARNEPRAGTWGEGGGGSRRGMEVGRRRSEAGLLPDRLDDSPFPGPVGPGEASLSGDPESKNDETNPGRP